MPDRVDGCIRGHDAQAEHRDENEPDADHHDPDHQEWSGHDRSAGAVVRQRERSEHTGSCGIGAGFGVQSGRQCRYEIRRPAAAELA